MRPPLRLVHGIKGSLPKLPLRASGQNTKRLRPLVLAGVGAQVRLPALRVGRSFDAQLDAGLVHERA